MSTVKRQFEEALKREKKYITKFYTGLSYQCLFRRISDEKNNTNYVQIFYEIDTPIYQGDIITYNGTNFIVFNKESIENDVYFKSTILECNLRLPIVKDGAINYIPSYMYDMGSTSLMKGSMLTLVDGQMEIITQSTDTINNLDYSSGYWIVGGYFKLINKYNLSGITHLFLDRDAQGSRNYVLKLSEDGTDVRVSTTIRVNPLIDGDIDSGATIKYNISDSNIAAIKNGVISFLSTGIVTIQIEWVEQNIIKTVTYNVTDNNPPIEAYSYSIITCSNPMNELTLGGNYRTLTPKFYESDDSVVEGITPIWEVIYPENLEQNFIVEYDGIKLKIKADGDYDLLDQKILIKVMGSNGGYGGEITLTVVL